MFCLNYLCTIIMPCNVSTHTHKFFSWVYTRKSIRKNNYYYRKCERKKETSGWERDMRENFGVERGGEKTFIKLHFSPKLWMNKLNFFHSSLFRPLQIFISHENKINCRRGWKLIYFHISFDCSFISHDVYIIMKKNSLI